MNIAIVMPELVVQGGGDRQAVYLALHLQEMGHQVTVFSPTYDRDRCYPDICSRLRIVVTGEHPLARLPLPSRRLKAYLNMLRLARSLRGSFDVINPHHWPPHWAAAWAARGISPRPAIVWMCNDPPWPRAVASKGTRLLRPLRLLSSLVFRHADRTLVGRVARTVALSGYAKNLIDDTYGVDCRIVRSGVDGEALERAEAEKVAVVRHRYGVDEGTFLALSLGILMPHRRIEDAIEAVARVVGAGHDIKYMIAGSAGRNQEYADSLRRLTHELGLDGRVIFAGEVPEDELKLYYHACDAFLFPNENQTWSLAVVEAIACGRPAIVSSGAAVSEALRDGETALLVPARDPEALASALTALVEDGTQRRAIAERGQRYVIENMSWERYAQSMLDIFEESLESMREAAPVAAPAAMPVAPIKARTSAVSRR